MVLEGQRVQPSRYSIIPRTLTFLLRGENILLMRLGDDRTAWAGKYNGVGGHIEMGEDAASSARREILEETSLFVPELVLSGVVLVDTGSTPGIGLFVFTGTVPDGDPISGSEGILEWIPLSDLASKDLVTDLDVLIPAALESRSKKQPFSALTTFDQNGKPNVHFSKR